MFSEVLYNSGDILKVYYIIVKVNKLQTSQMHRLARMQANKKIVN